MAKAKQPAKAIKSTDKKKGSGEKNPQALKVKQSDKKMIAWMDRLDKFLLQIVKEEKIVDTWELMHMLLLKARHIGFSNTQNDSPGNVLTICIKALLHGSDEAFQVSQAVAKVKMAEMMKSAATKKKVKKCPSKRNGEPST